MKKAMKCLGMATMVVCALIFASNAYATTIQVDDVLKISDHSSVTAAVSGGYGGAYVASSPDGQWDDFITFCLEVNEELTYNDPYVVGGISTAAKNGGVGGAVNGADEISYFTAWLYDQVVSGYIADEFLDDVQYAIWFEEQEITGLRGDALTFYNNQKSAFAVSGWTGFGNTRVINLTDENGNSKQDLLVSVAPVPEPATMLLLGAGLLGMGLSRKRIIKK